VAPGFYAHVFFFQKHVEEKKSHRRVSSNALRNYEIGKCPFELNDEIIINAINYNFLNKKKSFQSFYKSLLEIPRIIPMESSTLNRILWFFRV